MYLAQATPFPSSWQGSLSDLATIVRNIRRSHAFGRLTLRNTARLGVAHFYFRSGHLVHIVSNRGEADATLKDLQDWTRAVVRFVRGDTTSSECGRDDYEQLLDELIVQFQSQGIIAKPEMPRVIESNLIAKPEAEQLITPLEWQILVEGTRRVSLAVAHLVGPREAMNVLHDILDDCSAAFPAFSSFQISPNGYLQVNRSTQLDRLPRNEILEGFTALIATCQHFCSPIIGEADAHKLLIAALNDVGPALVSLGVFQVDTQLL